MTFAKSTKTSAPWSLPILPHSSPLPEGEGTKARLTAALVCLCGVVWASVAPAGEADWPQWRGPGRDGVAVGARLPQRLPTDPPREAWLQKLGTGWSSPVVADGRVFITDRQAGEERVLAFDAATGKPLWQRANPVDFDPHGVGRQHGNGPKATPVVAGGRIYALGIAGWLQCLDAASGAVIWQMHLPAQFGQVQPLRGNRAQVIGTEHVLVPVAAGQGAPVPLFGYTGSPLLADQRLVLEVGGQRGGTIMALDAQTGRPLWQALEENVAYSSPVVATFAGVAQVVALTGPRVVGLAVDSGKLLWSHPFQIQYDESISTPTIVGDLALVTGDRRPLTALRIARQGDAWSKSVAWENRDLSSYLSSMTAYDGHVYGMNDGGQFVCVRLSDGQTVWTGGDDGFYCTPVLIGQRLLGLNERGLVQILTAGPEKFERLGQYSLTSDATWTVPACVGGRLYVRDERSLRCFVWEN